MADRLLHPQIIDENGKVLNEADICLNMSNNRLIRSRIIETQWVRIQSFKEWIKTGFTIKAIKNTIQAIWFISVLTLLFTVSGLFDKLTNFIYKYKAIDFKLIEDGLGRMQVALDQVKTFAENKNCRYPFAVMDLAEAKDNLLAARMYYAHGYYYRAHQYSKMAAKKYKHVYWAIKNMVFN